MGRRGRLAVPVDGKPAPLEAPRGLDKETAAVFARIAAAVPRGHFVESDVALVTEYCRAVLMAKRADAATRVPTREVTTATVTVRRP